MSSYSTNKINCIASDWIKTSIVPTLDHSTHIWAIKLAENPAYLSIMQDWLSKRELAKSKRMLIELNRQHQIQSRAWLRWLLAKYTTTTEDQVHYQYSPLGKPSIHPDHGKIQFNATDSGTTLLCAFSQNHELGIDVETMPRQVQHTLIAKKKFTKIEQDVIDNSPNNHQSNTFLSLWTRKEAYGKAIGLGIRYPMQTVNLSNPKHSARFSLTDKSGQFWSLSQFKFNNNIACIVSTQSHESFHFYELDIDALGLT